MLYSQRIAGIFRPRIYEVISQILLPVEGFKSEIHNDMEPWDEAGPCGRLLQQAHIICRTTMGMI